MGEFEDPWEDEVEDEDEFTGRRRTVMEVDDENPRRNPGHLRFHPGRHVLGKDEVLEPDDSVYIMRHTMNTDWPCLSFDVLRDDEGDQRQRFPARACIVSGTQADTAKNNKLTVFKMTQLHKTQKDGESDDSDNDEDDDEDNLDEDPVLEYRSVPHFGGVNRVRAQPLPAGQPLPAPSQPYFVASWAETGKVHIWDVRPLIYALDTPSGNVDKERTEKPRYTVDAHSRAEGFAMDWAASDTGALRLLTGDIYSKIYLTTSTPTGFTTQKTPFISHTSSTVFASCSADQSVRVWDVRSKGRQNVAGIERHTVAITAYLLISGGDEGGIKIWDLRSVNKRGTNAPDPTPDSVFAASGADDQVTLWDLAVEQDDEETGTMDDTPESGQDIPPQLLFVHQGQKDVKEVHWHPQIPGTVISTARDGFNVFKTISI
ncbi:WD40-repeat-containing domain protein [Lactifluus volemus]|nr:WD40-repeat-containing domain protein [Lactifluus volemus]